MYEDVLNLKFYGGEDLYSDGDVEESLLKFCESGRDVRDVLRGNNGWPVLYHLSDIRENVLDWYEFNPEGTVLEIGAGCGAVTGLLCRKLARVTAIDLSKRRSMVNAARNGKYGNLEIFVGNFEDIALEEKFDYVTLIGVLEYAGHYITDDDPYLGMLKRARQFLKPGGKLVIAIENKFGLKYFAGAPEDHTGGLFDGIENYSGVQGVRTFSKPEITKLLNRAGFVWQKFYYPMPDYKLPDAIYSDEFLPKPGMLENEVVAYDRDRYEFFDERFTFDAIVEDGQFPYFANSFLIFSSLEAGREGVWGKGHGRDSLTGDGQTSIGQSRKEPVRKKPRKKSLERLRKKKQPHEGKGEEIPEREGINKKIQEKEGADGKGMDKEGWS